MDNSQQYFGHPFSFFFFNKLYQISLNYVQKYLNEPQENCVFTFSCATIYIIHHPFPQGLYYLLYIGNSPISRVIVTYLDDRCRHMLTISYVKPSHNSMVMSLTHLISCTSEVMIYCCSANLKQIPIQMQIKSFWTFSQIKFRGLCSLVGGNALWVVPRFLIFFKFHTWL